MGLQRYISSAYLIDGRKVHLRLYLAITELEPLRLCAPPTALCLALLPHHFALPWLAFAASWIDRVFSSRKHERL